MFFKKKSTVAAKVAVPEVPWDEKALLHFTKADRFDVQITSATKRLGFGATRENEPMREPDGYEISGLITYPKFILVTLSFDQQRDNCNVGFWFYHVYDGNQVEKT